MVRNLLAPRLIQHAFRHGPRGFCMYLEIVVRLWFLHRGWRFPRARGTSAVPKAADMTRWTGPEITYDRLTSAPKYPRRGEDSEYAEQKILETLDRRAEGL